jgi:hypothetical protein
MRPNAHFAQRHERALLDAAADFVEPCSFRAGDLDPTVSRLENLERMHGWELGCHSLRNRWRGVECFNSKPAKERQSLAI